MICPAREGTIVNSASSSGATVGANAGSAGALMVGPGESERRSAGSELVGGRFVRSSDMQVTVSRGWSECLRSSLRISNVFHPTPCEVTSLHGEFREMEKGDTYAEGVAHPPVGSRPLRLGDRGPDDRF